MRPVAWFFGGLMVANALAHFGMSIYMGAFAPGVYSSPVVLVAAIALVLKNKLAVPLFAVSLAAVVIQMLYVSFGLDAVGLMGTSSLLFPVVIIILGALQLWFSMYAKGRDWIT